MYYTFMQPACPSLPTPSMKAFLIIPVQKDLSLLWIPMLHGSHSFFYRWCFPPDINYRLLEGKRYSSSFLFTTRPKCAQQVPDKQFLTSPYLSLLIKPSHNVPRPEVGRRAMTWEHIFFLSGIFTCLFNCFIWSALNHFKIEITCSIFTGKVQRRKVDLS